MNRKQLHMAVVMVIVIVVCLIAIALAIPASAVGSIHTAKQDALHEAAQILRKAGFAEDSDAIRALQAAWAQEQEDLDIVARVVQGEAGNCPFEHQIAVAAVVVNRVNSPYFPNSVREVVAAPMQYTKAYLTGFDQTSQMCYEAARIALDGTDDVPDDVIWQAEYPQGTEIWWISEIDTGWFRSTTYFCRGVAWN